MVDDDEFLDDFDDENNSLNQNIDNETIELTDKDFKEQAKKNLLARQRIDELLEQKRLKELLDDENDW